MAAKRPNSAIHPSRQEQVPREFTHKRRKVLPPTHTSGVGKSFKKAHPTNDLKNQVRSIRRLLEHAENMPATVRVEKERALQSAQYELDEQIRAQKRSDLIGKYHKIRFFDRQKATKRLKRAKKELKEAEESEAGNVAELKEKVKDGEVDIAYAQNFPLDQAYVSLFPSRKPAKGDAAEDAEGGDNSASTERQGDPAMWQRVKECMSNGTLNALRNGTFDQKATNRGDEARGTAEIKKNKSSKAEGKSAKKEAPKDADRADDQDSGDGSDGGFFE